MADTRIWTTADFEGKATGARIRCKRCQHTVTVSNAIIRTMFPRPETLSSAERRLRCSKCLAREAIFEITRRPQR